MKRFRNSILFLLTDIIIAVAVLFIALVLVYSFTDFQSAHIRHDFFVELPAIVILFEILMRAFQVGRIVWRFAGVKDVLRIGACVLISTGVIYSVVRIAANISDYQREPTNVYVIFAVFLFTGVVLSRMLYTEISIRREARQSALRTEEHGDKHTGEPIYGNLMIIGCGSVGTMVAQMFMSGEKYTGDKVCCFIDDDPEKLYQIVCGVKVEGGRERIPEIAKKHSIDTIIYAIAMTSTESKREFFDICSKTNCRLMTVPSLQQILSGEKLSTSIRSFKIEDLLERDSIKLDLDENHNYLKGKIVMVTGGGGSIGSELCRQIASRSPEKLIIFDVYENSAYEIQNELKREYPELDLITLIGSVRDEVRLDAVFSTYKPDIVFHAAAHKHVPLMEDSPHESIKNNVFGTYNTALMADRYGTKRFVLISTDKAVNPTNIMGASKRICEMIVQHFNRISKTEFVAVRFGNVLGSNGSVIPLFKRQIENGGPVTVTHPDIIRYFMTIPEAVSLVLEAGFEAKGGEIFVLDMGDPVKIVTLAENMIRLSGYIPYETMDIKFTGLRPGEKLYEELLMDEEGLEMTGNKKIFIGHLRDFDDSQFEIDLVALKQAAYDEESDIRELVAQFVPTFHYKK